MKDDLSHIMSVTSEMGQKALGLEVRKEMKRLNIVIRDCQNQIEDGKKRLEQEKKIVSSKEAELVKHRHMHETALNSRNELIKVLNEDKNKLIEDIRKQVSQHHQQTEELRLSYEKILAQNQEEIKELSRSHDIQKKEIADSFEARIRNFYQKIDGLRVKVSELESTITKGQIELKSKIDEIFALSKKLAEAQTHIEALQKQLAVLEAELKAERESPYVKKVVKERDDLLSQNSVLRAKVDSLEASLATLSQISHSARTLLAERDLEISALQARLQDSGLLVENLTSERDMLCSTCERQAAQIESHLAEISSKKENIASLENELKVAGVNCAKLSEESKFLSAMAENLKSDLDEQTKKNDKFLTYLQSLNTEIQKEREQFKQDLEEANNRNTAELAMLRHEVSDLREYKASRLSVNFSQKETQTAELLESQGSAELSELEVATTRRISKRLSGLREKVNNIR